MEDLGYNIDENYLEEEENVNGDRDTFEIIDFFGALKAFNKMLDEDRRKSHGWDIFYTFHMYKYYFRNKKYNLNVYVYHSYHARGISLFFDLKKIDIYGSFSTIEFLEIPLKNNDVKYTKRIFKECLLMFFKKIHKIKNNRKKNILCYRTTFSKV